MTDNRTKHIGTYILVTFLLSWGWLGGAYALGFPWSGVNMVVLGAILMLIPGAVVLLMERKRSPGKLKQALGIGVEANRWWILAWLGPPSLTLIALGVSLLLPGHTLEHNPEVFVDMLGATVSADQRAAAIQELEALPLPLFWIQLIQGLTMGGLVTALFAFGEELGWRGLLDREASRAGWGFWKSSLVIGALWGLWHAPIILQGHNYPQHPVLGVFLMVLLCVGLAPLFTFVSRMAGSVLAAALAHGTLNATAMLPQIVVVGGSDLSVGISSLAGLGVLLAANLALVPLVRRHGARLQAFWPPAE